MTDDDVAFMYLAWKNKAMIPSECRKIKKHERIIIEAFMEQEIKESNEEKKALYGRG